MTREITSEELAKMESMLDELANWTPKRPPEIKPRPLPGFERYHHVGSYKRPNRHLAEVRETQKPLDAFNETLPLGVTLHPTKGYRSRSGDALDRDIRTLNAKHDLQAWLRSWMP